MIVLAALTSYATCIVVRPGSRHVVLIGRTWLMTLLQ